MSKLNTAIRLVAIAALFLIICAVYLIILVNLQITGQDYYSIIKDETSKRYIPIEAKRGEIYDRNGIPLVINTTNYCINLEYAAMPKSDEEFNNVILTVRNAIKTGGAESCLSSPTFPFEGEYPNYIRKSSFFVSTSNRNKHKTHETLKKESAMKERVICT